MIEYVRDLDKNYEEEILSCLREHNRKYSPQKPAREQHFYVLDEDKLIGALYSSVSWDWVGLRKLAYVSVEVLELLLSRVCEYYKEDVSGIKTHTRDKARIDDFISIGFVMNGTTPKTPKEREYYNADNTTLNITSNSSYKVITSDTEIQEYTQEFDEMVSAYNSKENINGRKTPRDIIFVALDSGKFAGGVLGQMNDDSMYVDLLVVKQIYRGKRIGTKLMELIEGEALKHNAVRLGLGTSEFQAKDFYRKLGFKVYAQRDNNPKGFKTFSMSKWLANPKEFKTDNI